MIRNAPYWWQAAAPQMTQQPLMRVRPLDQSAPALTRPVGVNSLLGMLPEYSPALSELVTRLGESLKDRLVSVVLYGSVVLASFASFWVLALAARSARWLKPIVMSVITRLMGLLLAAIAVQFIADALKEFLLL